MTGELYINGKDAYTEWGISMDDTSLSALMTPASNKALIENKSRLEHGKRVDTSNPNPTLTPKSFFGVFFDQNGIQLMLFR